MCWLSVLLLVFLASITVNAAPNHFQRNHEQTNLVFIMFDDLRLELFNYGRKHMITPNFERLAAKSVTFDNAHCQIAVCNPSRDSLLTGLRPDTVGTYGFQNSFGRHMILPQQLVSSGYATAAYGKLLHWDGDDKSMWSDESWQGNWYDYQALEWSFMNSSVQPDQTRKEEEFRDHIMITKALKGLQALERKRLVWNKPFMLGVGFKLPHLTLHIPYKYYAMYKDREELWNTTTAKELQFPQSTPAVGYRCCGETTFRYINDEGRLKSDPGKHTQLENINGIFPLQAHKELLIGYAAAVTFLDVQLGRLLDEMDSLKLWDKTTVVLTADHGMHNGEKGMWEKWTLFDEATRVPLMVYHPLSPFKGQHYRYPVELVDVYPTVTDLLQAPFKSRGKVCRDQYTCKPFQGKSLALVILGPKVWSVDKQKVNSKLALPVLATGGKGGGLRGTAERSAGVGRHVRTSGDVDGTVAPQLNPDLAPTSTNMRRRLETLMEFLTRTGKAIAANATLPPIQLFNPPSTTSIALPAIPEVPEANLINVNDILMHQDFALSQHWKCGDEKEILEKMGPDGLLRATFRTKRVRPFWVDCDMDAFKQDKKWYSLMGYSMRTLEYRYTAWVRFNLTSLTPIWQDKPFLRAHHVVGKLPESGIIYEELYDHRNSAGENGSIDPLFDYLHGELANLAYIEREPYITDLESQRRRLVLFLQRHIDYRGRVNW